MTPQQQADVIKGITACLAAVLGKDPATTFVVIEQVPLEAWGVGGLPVAQYRARREA
ncbi:4-oxalocrotonate tautomerase [Parvularcula dongshanensis]|uniref:4-oxalocrotonate tautomerase n=1 Tax=Parvularcula dongshanensis TaxID=1173995 RepID=A0A840I444_9PROT|nr:4-oxalocrotonate tautomerase [Parvularcula dongshanensis]